MKRLWCVFAILLIAIPGHAQDGGDNANDGGIFGDGGLFAGGASAGGNRGNRGQGQGTDRLATLKSILAKANAALTKDQEKSLNAILDREIKSMSDAFQAKFGGPPSAAAGAQRGARGGQGSGAPVEIRRMNEELLGKVVASLTPDQQAIILKSQKDQVRARGGVEALKLILSDAGASPLTAEQLPQVQSLYAEENQARLQLGRESQGPPDPAKITQLQLTTLTKVIRLLTPDQRKALQDSMKR